jgi:hypothetical protein
MVFFRSLARKIGNELNSKERKIALMKECIEKLEKTLEYYKILREEVESTVRATKRAKAVISLNFYLLRRSCDISTPTWLVLERSGELPKYFPPDHLKLFSEYFEKIIQISKEEERIFDYVMLNETGSNEFSLERISRIVEVKVSIIKIWVDFIVKLGEQLFVLIDKKCLEIEKQITNDKYELSNQQK